MMRESLSKFKLLVIAALEKGFLMILGCILAIIAANVSPETYHTFIHSHITQYISHSNLHYITNDLLMAIFFLLVGMEIKREMITGHLATKAQAMMPLIAAIGGMVGPMLIYVAINQEYNDNLAGWAIPTATDIAFTLTILSLFGKGIPTSVRVFLTALAIIDDLFAIIIIAIYYTASLNLLYLGFCFLITFCLVICNLLGVRRLSLYLVVGSVLWYCFLKSGIHATISGVILALVIPLRSKDSHVSPIEKLEKAIHKPVQYLILPLFAFVNSGVNFAGATIHSFFDHITLGIALGLFFGKQLGVFTTCYIGVKANLLTLPKHARWLDMYGASILCGIGFTMSLFVGMLSFSSDAQLNSMKIGVFSGSLLSIVYGAIILHIAHISRK